MGNGHLVCLFITLVLVNGVALAVAANVPPCSPSDKQTLLDLKSSLVYNFNETKEVFITWSASKSCCAWNGVKCNANGRVTGLSIAEYDLTFKKPELLGPSLSKLTELEVIIIQNIGYGTLDARYPLPSDLKSLSKLTTLSLVHNNFAGSIPSEWSQISSLQTLNLSLSPYISGNIPLSICNLKNLKTFSVENSIDAPGQLSGSIPSCLGFLPQLTALELGYNQLTGNIPAELGHLSNLLTFRLPNNQLVGNIPPTLGNLNKLRVLHLEGNEFSGELPQSLGKLQNLWELCLGAKEDNNGNLQSLNKQLSGRYPVGIGGRTSLHIVRIRGTSIGGYLPASLGKALTDIVLDNNEFYGDIPQLLSEAKKLKNINLAHNHFQGEIPPSLTNLSLSSLDLSNNQLTGPIPTDLGKALSAGLLNLHNNKLSGQFPTSLWQVRGIFLSNNQITSLPAGSAPSEVFRIQELFLDSNNLSGTIPIWTLETGSFINLANNKLDSFPVIDDNNYLSMNYLNVSHNLIKGSIPNKFANIFGMNTLDLSFNRLTGGIPVNFTSGSSVFNNLILSHNQLSGALPQNLFASDFFNSLDLSHNNLSGPIPDNIGDHSSFLSSVDLSYNHLSGPIPAKLFSVSLYLSKLKLSHNEFSGAIPDLASACQKTDINFVALNDNKFTGTLQNGSWIAVCATQMEVFDISGNQISGLIPDLSSWKLLKVLNLAKNQFTGKIPSFLMGGLPTLQVLDLSRNKLTSVESWNKIAFWKAMKSTNDSINDETLLLKAIYYQDGLVFDSVSLTQSFSLTFSATRAIDLSGNAITGQLPSNLGSNLKALKVLNVANNKFSGALPADMTSLQVLDVSNNGFTGKIPSSLQTFHASYFAGNPGLCGSPLPRHC